MKIIRISANKIENIIAIAGHYKVRYTDGVSPDVKEITLRNMESPEKAAQYVKNVKTRNLGKIIGKPEEVAIKEPAPAPRSVNKPSLPRNVKVIKENPAKPGTRPLPPQPQKGFRIDFYPNYNDPSEVKHTIYEDAETDAEARMLFEVEYPNGFIVGNPKNLSVKLNTMPPEMSNKELRKQRSFGKSSGRLGSRKNAKTTPRTTN